MVCARVRGNPDARSWAEERVLLAERNWSAINQVNRCGFPSPTVIRFWGLRVRYSMQGGPTMPLPRTRIILSTFDIVNLMSEWNKN